MTGLAPCRQREGWGEVEVCMAVRVDMMLTSWSSRSMLVGLQVDLDSCCAPLPCAVCRASLGGVYSGRSLSHASDARSATASLSSCAVAELGTNKLVVGQAGGIYQRRRMT